MRLLHSLAKTHASFDDPNLVSHAGLVPVMALAERAGLADLVAGHVRPGGEYGVNAHLKVPCLVAGMAAEFTGSVLEVHGRIRAFRGLPACEYGVMIDPSQDAFGTALLDYLDGKDVAPFALEVQGGKTGLAMHPEWFFRSFERWDWRDQEILPHVEHGPVLDLGAGAGRAALYLQERGLSVTAVDASPGAVQVCRRRGVADVRLGDVHDPPADKRWAAVLLLCGNLGLGGSWDGSRRLLTRLAGLVTPGAVLAGDSVTSAAEPHVDLRIRYRELVTPWWPQYNIPASQVATLVKGTGWRIEVHLEDGEDHAVLLRRT